MFLFLAHSACLEPVRSTILILSKWIGERGLCEAYFWMAGRRNGGRKCRAILLHPSFPQRTNFEVLAHYGFTKIKDLFQ